MLRIAALVFDELTPLDLVGPLEVLARAPDAQIVLVGERGGEFVRAPATTHWAHRETLERYGAVYRAARYVEHERFITAAGVSAGIDMSLALLAKLRGEQLAKAVQLSIEYDPQAPFDSGTPAKAGPELVERVRAAAARSLEPPPS